MHKKLLNILTVIVLLFTLVSCKQNTQSDKIKIVTTIFPAYSFTKEIVGDLCDVEVVLKPGQDSHNYDPSVSTVISIRNADMFIYTCDEMETWATKLISTLNKNTVVMAGKGIELEVVHEEEHDHDHPKGEHVHEHNFDPHIWTSIRNSIIMVKNIMSAVCGLDPDNSDIYIAKINLNELKKVYETKIDTIKQSIELANVKDNQKNKDKPRPKRTRFQEVYKWLSAAYAVRALHSDTTFPTPTARPTEPGSPTFARLRL